MSPSVSTMIPALIQDPRCNYQRLSFKVFLHDHYNKFYCYHPLFLFYQFFRQCQILNSHYTVSTSKTGGKLQIVSNVY